MSHKEITLPIQFTSSSDAKSKKSHTKPQPRMDLVIAHHEESLKWAEDVDWKLFDTVYIYHKGNTKKKAQDYLFPTTCPVTVHWLLLTNVGRESHTIVYHCIKVCEGKTSSPIKSDNLCLFVQGNPCEAFHAQSKHIHPIAQWNKYVTHGTDYHCSHSPDVWTDPGKIKHHGKWILERQQGLMKPTEMDMNDFYTYITNRTFPAHVGIPVSYGNQFAVSNKRICQHSIPMYTRALKILETHANPETGHYFERISRCLFDGTCDES
jgi:hypothetical protein